MEMFSGLGVARPPLEAGFETHQETIYVDINYFEKMLDVGQIESRSPRERLDGPIGVERKRKRKKVNFLLSLSFFEWKGGELELF